MEMAIIGAGSVGLLLASLLANEYDVTLYVRREAQRSELLERGICYVRNGERTRFVVRVKTLAEGVTERLAVVAVKQYDLDGVLPHLSTVDTVIFLQNGYGHIPKLTSLVTPNIALAIVEHGALRHNDYTVEHTGIGGIKLAVYRGVLPVLSQQFTIEAAWEAIVERKLLVNAVINPLTALFRVTNGTLLRDEHLRSLARVVCREVSAVFHLNEKVEWENVVRICRATAANRSSMLNDVDRQRPTENNAILGAVLHKASERNEVVPYCQFLYEAIDSIESRYGE